MKLLEYWSRHFTRIFGHPPSLPGGGVWVDPRKENGWKGVDGPADGLEVEEDTVCGDTPHMNVDKCLDDCEIAQDPQILKCDMHSDLLVAGSTPVNELLKSVTVEQGVRQVDATTRLEPPNHTTSMPTRIVPATQMSSKVLESRAMNLEDAGDGDGGGDQNTPSTTPTSQETLAVPRDHLSEVRRDASVVLGTRIEGPAVFFDLMDDGGGGRAQDPNSPTTPSPSPKPASPPTLATRHTLINSREVMAGSENGVEATDTGGAEQHTSGESTSTKSTIRPRDNPFEDRTVYPDVGVAEWGLSDRNMEVMMAGCGDLEVNGAEHTRSPTPIVEAARTIEIQMEVSSDGQESVDGRFGSSVGGDGGAGCDSGVALSDTPSTIEDLKATVARLERVNTELVTQVAHLTSLVNELLTSSKQHSPPPPLAFPPLRSPTSTHAAETQENPREGRVESWSAVARRRPIRKVSAGGGERVERESRSHTPTSPTSAERAPGDVCRRSSRSPAREGAPIEFETAYLITPYMDRLKLTQGASRDALINKILEYKGIQDMVCARSLAPGARLQIVVRRELVEEVKRRVIMVTPDKPRNYQWIDSKDITPQLMRWANRGQTEEEAIRATGRRLAYLCRRSRSRNFHETVLHGASVRVRKAAEECYAEMMGDRNAKLGHLGREYEYHVQMGPDIVDVWNVEPPIESDEQVSYHCFAESASEMRE
ncbi:hypothetical protein HDU93_001803 [Gonapodya sp. JEL0774]|nr:hypothetical protein HDU93_001803 [Gonapodya sp. JEL0774]